MNPSLKEQFLNPSDEFTPYPFWFWNDTLKEETITRQIEDFHAKGVDGFVIHPRIGIPADTPYLSDQYMHYVRYAVEEAARLNMHVVLYDEGMYPSGSAHGMVAASNPAYATRALRMEQVLFTGQSPAPETVPALEEGERVLSRQILRREADGQQMLLFFIECFSRGTIRGIHEGEDDGQPMAPVSADLLNPEAMQLFIHLTHDRYYEVLKPFFGTTVIAMFTDEPDVLGRRHRRDVVPWTEGFMTWWEQFGGKESDLPYLWLESEKSDRIRRGFQKAVNKRLGYSYYGQLSAWCQAHGIALTGHPAKSCDIGFLRYFQIPGQDLVYRWVAPEGNRALYGPDSTMAKCSSDAARHSGRRRNSNECFGCCGPDGNQWAFSADDMKWFLDWLFVRGVNMLYPHAFFYSIEGKLRYGERPPDVGPHNIWWPDYKLFSDYIKRMCWLMTDSANTTPIAILCEEDFLPWRMAGELYCNQIEFNYLEDNLILKGISCESGNLQIEKQNYQLLLVESAELLTPMLLECLLPFLEQGGQILVLDEEDGVPAQKRALSPRNITYLSDLADLVPAIDKLSEDGLLKERELRLMPSFDAIRVSHVIKNGVSFYLLVNEGEVPYSGQVLLPAPGSEPLAIECWHPWEGRCETLGCTIQNGNAVLSVSLHRRESLILCVEKQASRKTVVPLDRLTWGITHVEPAASVASAGLEAIEVPPQLSGSKKIRLSDWNTWRGMEHFSGTLRYETTLCWSPGQTDSWAQIWLDLGEVHEIARLSVNGQNVGVQMWAPYRFDITKALKEGDNLIQLEVTNSLAGGMSRSGLCSGLIGPVCLELLCRV